MLKFVNEAKKEGLNESEYAFIVEELGREPNHVERGILGVMWSEHCSYKSTRYLLKNLPTQAEHVLVGPGENAGVIALDEDCILGFKVESHNHPSFIEPFQGAATGVGGILRDIFTMGLRPVALLNSIHFGPLEDPMAQKLLDGVVSGIGFYGNCMGIPTLSGETEFHASYAKNNLVNAMAIGVGRRKDLHLAAAKGEGNLIVYLGSKTGRDGIHGAVMASDSFDSAADQKLPTVQVGDPYVQKCLMEVSLEMMHENLLEGIQDMGAAGITCSTFEMAERGGVGLDIELDRVPLRDSTMDPYDVFLSESQERMLLVVTPQRWNEVEAIAKRWDLDVAVVGKITDSGTVRAKWHGEDVIDLPVDLVCGKTPAQIFDRGNSRANLTSKAATTISAEEVDQRFLKLLETPGLSDKAWVHRQYDSTVGSDTVIPPGLGIGMFRVKDKSFGVATTLDSNARACQAAPREGIQQVFVHGMLKHAGLASKVMGVTNCLNYGSPAEPDVMEEIASGIEGLGEVAKCFDVPVTGGNVSLYNQTEGTPIAPTPSIGLVGKIEEASRVRQRLAKIDSGTEIGLIRLTPSKTLHQGVYAEEYYNGDQLGLARLDLSQVKRLCDVVHHLVSSQTVALGVPVGKGGPALTILRKLSALNEGLGFEWTSSDEDRSEADVFDEGAGQMILFYEKGQSSSIERALTDSGFAFERKGHVVNGSVKLSANGQRHDVDALGKLKNAYIGERMDG